MKLLWCRLFHRRILHPTGEKYLCAVCLTEWYNPLQGDTKWYEKRRAVYRDSSIEALGTNWFSELFSGGK